MRENLNNLNFKILNEMAPGVTLVQGYPANTKHLYNIYTMLAQRLRRWSSIVLLLYKYFVFAG